MRSETRTENLLIFYQELTYRSFLVDRFDDELLVVKGDVPDFTPGKADLWGHSGECERKTLLILVLVLLEHVHLCQL